MNYTTPSKVLSLGNFKKCCPDVNFKLSNNINDNKYFI